MTDRPLQGPYSVAASYQMAKFEKAGGRIGIAADMRTAFSIVSAIQMALRHPHWKQSDLASAARHAAHALIRDMESVGPDVVATMQAGWDDANAETTATKGPIQ